MKPTYSVTRPSLGASPPPPRSSTTDHSATPFHHWLLHFTFLFIQSVHGPALAPPFTTTVAIMDVDPRAYESVAINDGDVQKIVLAYLMHNCFKETAEAFIACTDMKCAVEWYADLDKRKSIYSHTLEGDALKAIELTNQLAPDLLQKHKDVLFDLLTLHFVELVRGKNCTGALEFAQRELSSFGKLERYIEKLKDFLTLLAYEEPEKSPVFQLLSMDHRQNVADSLNRIILVHHKLRSYTSLERLLQQVTVVRDNLNLEGKFMMWKQDGSLPFSLKNFLKHRLATPSSNANLG